MANTKEQRTKTRYRITNWPEYNRALVRRGSVTIWLDNQLPPALAAWMRATLGVECLPIRDLNLQRASDPEIFTAARATKVVFMTKDDDFVRLVEHHGPPPQVVLVTCGNTSNANLRPLVLFAWPSILMMLDLAKPLWSLAINRRAPTIASFGS